MADFILKVDTAVEVFVNVMPLLDDTDFKTRETAVAYNAAGMDLVWNFQTAAGVVTQTAVTPTTAGSYDWTHVGDGMYKIEIPASGGASINNDTEGFGWFSGVVTGVLPWRGPVIQFSPANVVDSLVNGSDALQVDVTQIGGDAQSATDLKDFADAGYDPATNKVQGVVLTDTVTTYTGNTPQTGDAFARLGAPAGASVSADIAAVKADTAAILIDTAEIGAAGAGLTALASAANLATVAGYIDTEVGTIVTAVGNIEADTQDIQTRLPAALVGGRIDANVGAISADATAADNLEAVLDGTGGVDLNIRQLISTCEDALPNIVLAGTGSADGIAFTRSGSGNPFDTEFAAQIQQEATDALNAYDPPTNAEMVARTLAAADYATAANLAIVDGIVDEILTDTGTTIPAELKNTGFVF